MARFQSKGSKKTPGISTSSLPDIIFMLLFFFMVTTSMREVTLKVSNTLPMATDVSKLERKSLVSYIYIGQPLKQYQDQFGTEPMIQLNDVFASVTDVKDFIANERASRNEMDVPLLTTSLKVDKDTKMGIVTDVKQELRKLNALKINYSSKKSDKI